MYNETDEHLREGGGVGPVMTFDDLTQLLSRHLDEDECFQEAYDCITRGPVRYITTQPGKATARTLLMTWELRERTTREAGISRLGFETTLRNLASRSPDEQLMGWAFECNDKAYVAFTAEADEAEEERRVLVGCIRVTKRPLTPLDKLTLFLQEQNAQHHWQEQQEERCAFVLYQLLVLKLVRPVGNNPTKMSASEALQVCQLEQRTAQQGEMITMGFERTQERLRLRTSSEPVLQWVLETLPNYSGEGRNGLFRLFIFEADQEVAGCVSVERRLVD